jgi:raffinose/stachyose/melibiose transport system permease protein
MSILAAIVLAPILFLVFSSVKSPSDFYGRNVFTLPTTVHWSNLVKGFDAMKRYMLNGAIISMIKVPLGILIEASVAFAITRLRVRNPRLIFILFLIGMMIPVQITLVPLNIGFKIFGLQNTHLGLILVYLGFGIPFGILVMRGFFRTIPKEPDTKPFRL